MNANNRSSAPEHERLDLQTVAINRMMHGRPIRAPLASPARILEVGCGTGAMTSYFAETYPSAKDVIGIDLSPVPPRQAPTRATFIQGDFRQMVPGGEYPELLPNSFYYAFSRMLACGMNNWPAYIAQVKELLKPGGWIELQDLDLYYWDQDERPICESWRWLRDQTAAWAARGLDVRIGWKLERYLREAGFVDVRVEKFRWIFGRWKGHAETDMIGEYSPKYLIPANLGAYKKVLGLLKSIEGLSRDEAEMEETLAFTEDGKHQGFYVVCGRKP